MVSKPSSCRASRPSSDAPAKRSRHACTPRMPCMPRIRCTHCTTAQPHARARVCMHTCTPAQVHARIHKQWLRMQRAALEIAQQQQQLKALFKAVRAEVLDAFKQTRTQVPALLKIRSLTYLTSTPALLNICSPTRLTHGPPLLQILVLSALRTDCCCYRRCYTPTGYAATSEYASHTA